MGRRLVADGVLMMWHIEVNSTYVMWYDNLDSVHTLMTKTSSPAFSRFGDETWSYDHEYYVMLF